MIGIKSLSHGFAVAFADMKKGAKAVADFLAQHGPQITADVKIAGGALTSIVPSAGAAVTTVSRIQEAAMGEVLAAAHALEEGETPQDLAVTIPAELVPALKALAGTLSGHPAVAAGADVKATA